MKNNIITVNSISGGKTSAYLMKHYPANINIFALVRVEDKENLWMKGKDEKTRQLVSDRIGKEFIGTVEMDTIIYTLLDLEQFTGQGVNWVAGDTFEEVIRKHSNYLPNKMARFCTTDMKIIPIFNFLKENTQLPVKMNIGLRPTEKNRATKIMERADKNGLESFKTVIGKSKVNNKWGDIPYRYVEFPLIQDNIQKDVIYNYWNNKPVRFAYRNNCVGCVNRNPLFLSHIAQKDKDSFNWFVRQEEKTGNAFNSEAKYKEILKYGIQNKLFDDDFDDCDTGYCGI
tara:strand:+ start:16830 stop:17687 length:858 start_codon:yes stop_codon:yes gene_type:complete